MRAQTVVRMPDDLHERLRLASFEQRKSQNDILIEAFILWLASQGYGEANSSSQESFPTNVQDDV